MGTPDLQPVSSGGQRLANGILILKWGQSGVTEPFNLWDWKLTPDSVRTELSCRTPSWCQRVGQVVLEKTPWSWGQKVIKTSQILILITKSLNSNIHQPMNGK